MATPLWSPTRAQIEATRLEEFRRSVETRHAVVLPDYDALHAWSVAQPQAFWSYLATWCRLPLTGTAPAARSVDPMPKTRWFEGAHLNYAQALLYPPALESPDQLAIIGAVEPFGGQPGAPDTVAGAPLTAPTCLTYAELRVAVAQVQGALRRTGIGHGDHVVAFAANVPATVVLLLACAGMGVRLATCSPDFGAVAAAARFGQLAPRALFASCGYAYGGRWFDTSAVASSATTALAPDGSLCVIGLPYPGRTDSGSSVATAWEAWLEPARSMPAAAVRGRGQSESGAPASGVTRAGPELELLALPFDEPLSVLFSSGTTGVPKALVHRAGGMLLTHAKEHALHCDIRAGDTVFYFSTCGWMMWNWQVSALAQGATLLLYDGSPAYPDVTTLFALAERHAVSFFGTSARFIHALRAAGAEPSADLDLSSIRTVASTGSPLSPAGFEYVYQHVGADLHLASISGGTDIVGCFMLGVPTLPVYAGQIQRPGLGVDLAVYDADGAALVGEPGELVCKQPLPSMPLAFVGDDDFVRYRAAYLQRYPGVWHHGDRLEFTPEGGIVVHGRSDATLNPGGVRIGTAEVYRALESVEEVLEAAAVGKKVPAAGSTATSDEEVWLAVVLKPGAQLSDELLGRITAAVRRNASPRHVPRRIIAVADLPRTRSGKLMELVVAAIVNGAVPGDVAAVANPASLLAVRDAVAAATQ